MVSPYATDLDPHQVPAEIHHCKVRHTNGRCIKKTNQRCVCFTHFLENFAEILQQLFSTQLETRLRLSRANLLTREWPRYCRKVHWTKMVQSGPNDHFGQNDLIPNRILAFARPKWTKMVQFGPFWPEGFHFGPFRSANRTLAIPDLHFMAVGWSLCRVSASQKGDKAPFCLQGIEECRVRRMFGGWEQGSPILKDGNAAFFGGSLPGPQTCSADRCRAWPARCREPVSSSDGLSSLKSFKLRAQHLLREVLQCGTLFLWPWVLRRGKHWAPNPSYHDMYLC